MDYGYIWYDGDQKISLDNGDIQPSTMLKDIAMGISVDHLHEFDDVMERPYEYENNLYEIDLVA